MDSGVEVQLYFPHSRALEHSMSYALDAWALGKVFLPAIEDCVKHGWPIQVHGLFPHMFQETFPNTAAGDQAGDTPKHKRHNTMRPRYFWETCASGTKCLHLAVAPGYDYLLHFAGIARHVLGCLTTQSPKMVIMHYPPIDAGLAEMTGLRTEGLVLCGDIVVLGHVDEVRAHLTARHGARVVSAFDTEMYSSTRVHLGPGVLNFLGCQASFWGNMAGTLCRCLCSLGCREVIYVGKLGTLRDPDDMYTVLYSPSHYFHARHAEESSVRAIAPSQCPNRLLALVERSPWVATVRSGRHASVGTVVEEDLQQVAMLRRLGIQSIDTELFYMAEAVHLHNEALGPLAPRVSFTPIHFATDYLRPAGEVARRTPFDLSSNRSRQALERKAAILGKAAELLARLVQGSGAAQAPAAAPPDGAPLDGAPRGLDSRPEGAEAPAAPRGRSDGPPPPPVYLDHAGAALVSAEHSLLAERALEAMPPGNPHTSAEVRARLLGSERRVLQHFGVSPETYRVVFTSNATAALRLVGDSFRYGPAAILAYDLESHTSVLGLRPSAKARGARAGWYDMDALESLASSADCLQMLDGAAPPRETSGPSLLVVTAESNFSGAQADLAALTALRRGRLGWRVLLDAAKYCAAEELDLERTPADFVALSFYKMFGRPTGLGALLVRADAQHLLAGDHYFGGGSVGAVSAKSDFAAPADDVVERLSYGTPNFRAIAELPVGFEQARRLHGSLAAGGRHAKAVAAAAAQRMRGLRHSRGGGAVCELYGRWSAGAAARSQGPTIAFNVFDARGHVYPYLHVEALAKRRGLVLRAGSLCNVGGCQKYLGLTCGMIKSNYDAGSRCSRPVDVVDGRPTGVLRASFGPTSSFGDVDKLLEVLETFVDAAVAEDTCSFCRELVLRLAPSFMPKIPGHTRHSVEFPRQPPELAACAALGSLCAGYLLLVPRRHALSFAALPAAELREAGAFVEAVRGHVSGAFGPAIAAEHGSGAEGGLCSASCIDHAHLHVIPLQGPALADQVLARYEEVGGPGKRLDSLCELQGRGGRPYVLLSPSPGVWWLWDTGLERFPKQFVRRVVAEARGTPESFDWREEPHYDNMKDTLDHFSRAFQRSHVAS